MGAVRIKTPKGYRVAGAFDKGVFSKTVSRKKHFVWAHKGWGFDASVVAGLRKRGCSRIVLKEKDAGVTLIADFADIISYGVKGSLGNGYGSQVFLADCHFKNVDEKQGRLI